MKKRLAILLVIAACGGSKDSGPGKDWSGKPLDVTIESKVNDVGFSITAPKGMKLDGSDSPDELTKHWEADLADQWSEPSFMVSYASIPATDLPGFINDLMLGDGDIVAKQEKTADGFVVIHHTKDKGQVVANVMKAKGEHTLTCRASQAKDKGVPNPDKTIAWLEKLCGSLTIQ